VTATPSPQRKVHSAESPAPSPQHRVSSTEFMEEPIGCKWIYGRKINPDGPTRYKPTLLSQNWQPSDCYSHWLHSMVGTSTIWIRGMPRGIDWLASTGSVPSASASSRNVWSASASSGSALYRLKQAPKLCTLSGRSAHCAQ
jgi:hypothetical protein